MSDSLTAIAPDSLFVVACPVCQGQVAAVGGFCGRDVCCPLCASLFHVPDPAAAAATPVDDRHDAASAQPASTPPAPEPLPAERVPAPVGMAEDWGGVITKLAPARKDPEPEPTSTIELTDFDLPAAADSPTAEGEEAIGAFEPAASGGDTEADEPAEVVGIASSAPSSPPRRAAPRQSGPQVAAGDDLPVVGGTPLDPKASELVFSEPVRTIRHGETVIEIRRLTPEERRARRFRRNVLMIVVGVSILLTTYLLLSGR
jgi:hypothetical protein